MKFGKILTALLSLFIIGGCGAGAVREVPISLRYLPSQEAKFTPLAGLNTVGLGLVEDARVKRPAGAVGERIRFTAEIDRFHPKKGVAGAIERIVRGYFVKRNVRVLKSTWNGNPDNIWEEKGDMVLSIRVLALWFSGSDSVALARASSTFRIELKAGSPRTGTVITKTIQIDPSARRNIFWESGDVEIWLSRSISEAFDRILPGLGRRLAG